MITYWEQQGKLCVRATHRVCLHACERAHMVWLLITDYPTVVLHRRNINNSIQLDIEKTKQNIISAVTIFLTPPRLDHFTGWVLYLIIWHDTFSLYNYSSETKGQEPVSRIVAAAVRQLTDWNLTSASFWNSQISYYVIATVSLQDSCCVAS